MLFKDEVEALLMQWSNLRLEGDIEDLAAITTVAIAKEESIPVHVLDAVDGLMKNNDYKGRRMLDIVRYLQDLRDKRSVRGPLTQNKPNSTDKDGEK